MKKIMITYEMYDEIGRLNIDCDKMKRFLTIILIDMDNEEFEKLCKIRAKVKKEKEDAEKQVCCCEVKLKTGEDK